MTARICSGRRLHGLVNRALEPVDVLGHALQATLVIGHRPAVAAGDDERVLAASITVPRASSPESSPCSGLPRA